MKKIIRLTEDDLTNLIKRVINEGKKKPSNKEVEKELRNLLDDLVGEDEYTGGHYEFSDEPYDRFRVDFKRSGDDTEEIAEKIFEKLNDKLDSNLSFKLGNSSKKSFWFYIK